MDGYFSFLVNTPQGHLLLISALHLLAWSYCLTLKGFVIDDIDGVAKFSDRFIQERNPQGQVVKEYKVDYYEEEVAGKKIQVKNTAWNPVLPFPNNFVRWYRVNLGKKFKKIGIDTKGHSQYGWVQDAPKHHLYNLLVQWANLFLGYNLFANLFDNQTALFAILLFSVHPCGVQTVGWISGVNYLLSLLGSLLSLNAALYITNPYILFPVIAITSAVSCVALLPGCFTFVILFMLGYTNAGIMALIIGSLVLLKTGTETVKFRVAAFKQQQMGKSTGISIRKLIIIVKTFWYYVRIVLFPKRLGLFHPWGYHFEEPLLYVDKEFWLGLLSIAGYVFAVVVAPAPVSFGLIWAVLYWMIFCNIVTAQQFVSERYVFIPVFGISLAVSYYLHDYPVVFAFILGVFIMRVWVYLPTFANEVRYYESNCFNFPNSEVSMGNLGVSYLNHGMPYKAWDTWQEATRQNPLYDVPWYNLYSLAKQNGDILKARAYLQKCLDAKVIHFPEQWKKEMVELDTIIAQAISDGRLKQVPQPLPVSPTQ